MPPCKPHQSNQPPAGGPGGGGWSRPAAPALASVRHDGQDGDCGSRNTARFQPSAGGGVGALHMHDGACSAPHCAHVVSASAACVQPHAAALALARTLTSSHPLFLICHAFSPVTPDPLGRCQTATMPWLLCNPPPQVGARRTAAVMLGRALWRRHDGQDGDCGSRNTACFQPSAGGGVRALHMHDGACSAPHCAHVVSASAACVQPHAAALALARTLTSSHPPLPDLPCVLPRDPRPP